MPELRSLLNISMLICFSAIFWPCASADESGPLFVKVYAGPALNTARDFDKAVRQNLKQKENIPDETLVACERGRGYLLGVIVSAPGKQTFSFETTAIWRDLGSDRAPRKSTREHTLRKNQYGTRRFFFKIRDGSVDHDMTFVAHIGNTVYLRHRFLIRGCDDASAPLDQSDGRNDETGRTL